MPRSWHPALVLVLPLVRLLVRLLVRQLVWRRFLRQLLLLMVVVVLMLVLGILGGCRQAAWKGRNKQTWLAPCCCPRSRKALAPTMQLQSLPEPQMQRDLQAEPQIQRHLQEQPQLERHLQAQLPLQPLPLLRNLALQGPGLPGIHKGRRGRLGRRTGPWTVLARKDGRLRWGRRREMGQALQVSEIATMGGMPCAEKENRQQTVAFCWPLLRRQQLQDWSPLQLSSRSSVRSFQLWGDARKQKVWSGLLKPEVQCSIETQGVQSNLDTSNQRSVKALKA